MSGYVALWACFCSDASLDAADLPERCPCHNRRRFPVVDLDEFGRVGGVTTGHRCPPTQDPA